MRYVCKKCTHVYILKSAFCSESKNNPVCVTGCVLMGKDNSETAVAVMLRWMINSMCLHCLRSK
ncbi:hypothetical protein FOWG_18216 [Fusarium oxysporum f. sp. lycopersici MN25]|nr:hypothetical protein FOWG_18216 [Fusarium oxysporum f. sp. lycopersici MN25]